MPATLVRERQVPEMPRTTRPDSTLHVLSDPYGFISKRCRELNSDVFQTRLLLRHTVCMMGREAPELFSDPIRFVRAGAMPGRVQKTLFGQGGVQGLDDGAHRHRKQMFLSLMSPERIDQLTKLATEHWRAAARAWARLGTVALYDASQKVLCRAVCEWAGVPLANGEVRRFYPSFPFVAARACRIVSPKGIPRCAWTIFSVDGHRAAARGVATHTAAGPALRERPQAARRVQGEGNMTEVRREFGMVGLGRMGGGLALQARDKGIRVVGYDSRGMKPELSKRGVVVANELADFTRKLASPRAVFLYIPAGPGVDALLDDLTPVLEQGDIIIDGGNSYWGDSIRRHKRLAERGLELLDLGTSGGVSGARWGACFMVGGVRSAVERIEPMLLELAVEGGYTHAGPPGAGHFTKLVHNGIEFGMLQAIGEGVDLLEHFPEKLDIPSALSAWRHGSVIRGWLIDLMHQAYVQERGLDAIPGYVEDTGEVNWLVADALRMELPIPVISQSVMQLFASRDERKGWARAIATMRRGFGGHPYGKSVHEAEERKTGQVGCTFRDAVSSLERPLGSTPADPPPPRGLASRRGSQ